MKEGMLRLKLPARIEALKDCCAFVRGGAEASNLAPQEMDKLDLVLEELFVNIARYAYGPEKGDVEVGYTVEAPGRLAVQLSDFGREFDPLAAAPVNFNLGLDDRPLGGMGIFLVKTLTDSIRYQRSGGRNTLSFIFSGQVRGAGD
jgi:serine/threonine-protein kinase RsbW